MANETVNAAAREGAAAFIALIREAAAMGERDLERYADLAEEGHDVRDYRAMANMVDGALRSNLFGADAEHAQGFLRALTDLLCILGDGMCIDEDWDPISNTAAAFGELAEAQHG